MSVTCTERFESRRLRTGDEATLELVWTVQGTDDEGEAHVSVLAPAPEQYQPSAELPRLFRQSVRIEPLGPEMWLASVLYDRRFEVTIIGGGLARIAGSESNESFETGGGTQRITQSLRTVQRYGDAPDHQGAIGVSQSQVEGTDIVIPTFSWSETHYFAQLPWSYRRLLSDLSGTVNERSFRGFEPGEVLFRGASGSRRGDTNDQPWEVSFSFSASANVTDLAVGDVTGIEKRGFEYLWIRYQAADDEVSGSRVQRPVGAYVEQVYATADFSRLGIGVLRV